MAVPLPQPQPVSQAPTLAGDQANSVISGTFTAKGPSAPLLLYGTYNIIIYGSVNTTLTTTAGSLTASVASATGLYEGAAIYGANIPRGTTIGTLSGTTVTLALPPGYTAAANVSTGADTAALFYNITPVATVQVERSFDGGKTWVVVGVGGGGAAAVYANPASISIQGGEAEKGMAYRLNCTAYTSGTINYRISATGQMALTTGVLTV